MAVFDTVVKEKGEGGDQRQLLQDTLMVRGQILVPSPIYPHATLRASSPSSRGSKMLEN